MATDCKVTFSPKRTSSDNLLVEEAGAYKTIWICFRRHEIYTADELSNYITDILKYCLTHRVDTYRIHIDRLKGARLIKKVAHHTNYNDLGLTQIVALIWSSLSVVHHFHIRVMRKDHGYRAWYRKKQYSEALGIYEKVLLMFLPQLFSTVIQAIITFINESKIWQMESLIATLLERVLIVSKDNDSVINQLFDLIEVSDSVDDARNILKVLHRLFNYIEWKEMDEFLITRFMDIYRKSTLTDEFETLRNSFELCIRNALKNMRRKDVLKIILLMLEWVPIVDSNSVIEFGNLMEYASGIANNDLYEKTINEETLSLVLELVASNDMYLSLLGNRMLYYMLDRNCNQFELSTPKIFYQDVETNLRVKDCHSSDKRFLESFHQHIHASLMKAVFKHSQNRVNLESIYANIAVIAVEAASGYTAAATVSLAMSMQEFAINGMYNMLEEHIYQVHACVMAIMSLVCYIHKATIFYDYVNIMLERRAKYAPQLNPPICHKYISHCSYLARDELYFEDWEVRYGLWKCFITSNIKTDEYFNKI